MIMQDEPRLTLKMSSPYPIILTLICPFSLSVCLCLSLSQLAHVHDSYSYGNREITFQFFIIIMIVNRSPRNYRLPL